MHATFKTAVSVISTVICTLLPVPSRAAVQMYLSPLSEGVCRLPMAIKVYALNEEGKVDKEYEGKKKVTVAVLEESGKIKGSFTAAENIAAFKKGESIFSVEDVEAETVKFEVMLEDIPIAAVLEVSFENKDVFPPEIATLMVEKNDVIILKFNEVIEEHSGLDTENYTAVTDKREIHPCAVEYHKDYVVLKFSPKFDSDEQGYIEIEGIKDLSDNEVSSGARSEQFRADCDCD